MPVPYIPDTGRPIPRLLGDLLYCEHIEGNCVRCGRWGMVRLHPLVEKHGPDITLNEVWQRMRCRECGGGAKFPPKIVSADPKAGPSDSLRNYYLMGKRRPESEWYRPV